MKSKKIIALVLSASLVATQNNIITLANTNKINYYQNNIEKLQTNSLEDNKIHIKGAWWQTHDEFVIGFNKNEKKIKVYNQGNWYSYRDYGYRHYCRIQIFRKGAGEVLNIELLGWDTGNSPKLNVLKDFKYEYGDVIKFHFREPDKQIIEGNIIDANQDFKKGIKNIENFDNLGFEITENGLKQVYNQAPIVSAPDYIDLNIGDKFYIDEFTKTLKAADDLDGDVSSTIYKHVYGEGGEIKYISEGENFKKKAILDTEYLTTYKIEFVAKDSWQRKGSHVTTVRVTSKSKLEKNKINVLGFNSEKKFNIGFDEKTKKFKIENQINSAIHDYETIINREYFTAKVLDKNNNEKAYVELKGGDFGTSEKLNILKDLNYEYGDILIFNHLEKDRFRIDGEIIDGKENYADGVENDENLYNTVFEITKNGLKAIYNEAPILNGVEDITIRKLSNEDILSFGSVLLNGGISATDEREGDITENINLEPVTEHTKINFEVPGEYIFKYSISDKWGRTAEKLKKFTVVDRLKLEENFIRVDGFGDWGKRDKFKIGFDDINKTIKIYDQKSDVIHSIFNNYFSITIFDKNGKEKKNIILKGNDTGYSDKLKEINNFKYEYGDLIKLWHGEPSKLHIKGTVIDATKNYSDEITGVGRNDLILEITKNGLKEVQNVPPVIQGVEEIKVRKGGAFNLLEGVTVSDEREGDITKRLVTEGNVDINKVGEYNVVYIISNSLGIETRVNRKVNVVEIPKLEENKINIFGYNSTLFFTIGFDDLGKEFKVYNQYNDKIHIYYRPQTSDYFSIKILNKNIEEKLNINLIGVDKGNSDKLNNLKKFKFEYGDIIKLYHLEPSTRLKIDGKIIDAKEDYSDAIQSRENIDNTVFQITENGLKAIYNEAPVIKGAENIKVRKNSNFNLKRGVIVTDDLDGEITSNLNVKGNLDISKLGDYTIVYEATDSLGRKTTIERVITVVEVPKLESNNFEFAGEEWTFTGWTKNALITDLKFNLGFNDINKKIKIYNHVSASMHTKSPYKQNKYFEVKLLDKNGVEKVSQSFKGEDTPYSPNKISNLYNVPYEYGDVLKIYHAQPEKLRVIGNIINGKEDYSDGINNINNVNDIENIGFEITENGLKYIYNNKPEIKGIKDITIRQGEIFNKLEGISAIDDRDGDITSKINVSGDLDTNKLGEYRVYYTVEDSWGRQSRATAHIRVIPIPKLENNFIQVKGIVATATGEEKFKIGFDDIKKEFKVYDSRQATIHDYYPNINYFTIKILNKNRKEKISINLVGNDNGTSDKLDALKTFKYTYGDRIKLFHAESNRLDINGEVIDGKIDYSQRIWFDTNAVEFEITENGLKAIYNEAPIITGAENTIIKIGEAFDSLEGVIVKDDHDKNLVPKVIGNVDINKLGNYELAYSVRDSWGAEQIAKRVVTVRSNTKPTITGVNKVIINVGEPFNIMQGISANDVEDNDLTSSIKVKGTVNNNLVGTYILTYVVIDSDGNKVNATRTVVVKSNDKPVITGTGNVEIKVGDDFDPLFEVEATDTEDGDLTELISVKGTVNTTIKGTYDLIYSIRDEDGNETIATRRVIVRSNDKPVFQGIKNSVIKIGDTFDKLIGITAIDTEDKDLTSKISVEGNVNISKAGIYKLTYVVIDSDGNEVRKIRNVTVKTNDKPIFEGINNITIKVGDDFEPLLDISATDTEDGDITKLIKVDNNVDVSNPAQYEVIYTVTDLDKNTTTAKRIVTVRSNDKPVIEGASKVTLKVGDNFNPMDKVIAKDTEDGDLTKSINIIGTVDTNIEGITNLIYSVIDNDGNETKVNRHITVRSNNKPTIIGIDDITIKAGDIFDNMSDITAYDEEDGDITESIKIEGTVDINTVGTYKLNYKVVDDDENEVSHNRIVTVRSNTKPNITGVESSVVKVGDAFDKISGVSAIDIEDGDITKKLTVQGEVNSNVVGKYELIYSVIDSDDNIKTLKRIVRVRSNTMPVITGIEDMEIKIGDKFNPLFKVIAKDTEDGELTQYIEVQNKVNTLQKGEYEVIYTVKDFDNNIVTIPRKVTVRSNDKPVLRGVDRLTIKIGDKFDPMNGVSAYDTESGDISNLIKVNNNVDILKKGIYDVIYSVIDNDGNKTVATRKVNVRSNDKPRFEGINNLSIKVGDDFDSLFGVNAYDTEDGDISNFIKVKGTVNKSLPGQYDLIYSIKDRDNNEVINTRRITVRSNNKPVLLGADNLVIRSGDSFDKTLGVTATDIENGDLTNSIIVKGEVDTNTPGVYDLIYSVTDNDYNKTTVTRKIIVRTNEKPELIGADPITIKVGDVFDYMEDITAIDLEDNNITKNIVVTGNLDTNTIGTYNLVYSIKDSDNNETLVTRKIVVRSNEKPVILGVDEVKIKVNDEFDILKGISASDNEDNDLTSLIKVEGNIDKSKEGKYILTYSVVDSDGNETIVARSVTITTNNKPKLTGVEDVVIKLGDDFDKFIGVEAIDHEDGEINHLIKVEGNADIKSIGTYNLVYSVTDNDGNKIEANRKITVRSNDKPIILGADNKIIKVGDVFNEREGIIANDTEDKDLTKSIVIKGNVDANKVGKYVLDYLVEDSDGNKTVKTRVITVRSNDKPIIMGAENITIKLGDEFDEVEGVIVTDTEDGEITDLLDIEGDVDVSKVGVYNLVYSLTDEDGNELRKTRTVTVRSNDKPIILGADQLTIKVGDSFDKLKGIAANDTEDGDITNNVTVEGEVDSSKAEAYNLFYSVIDNDGNKVRVKRRVIVKTNTKPIIDIDDVSIKIGEVLDYKAGLVATDIEDGNLTNYIKVIGNVDNNKAGIYDLTYSVTDKDGNTTTSVRKVTVRTNNIPIIEGIDNVTIKVNEYFNPMFRVIAKDTEDGDLTKELKISGNVDINNAGKYNLVYSVLDSDGNLVTKTRTIFVKTNNKPKIKGAINTKIKVGDTFDKLKDITAIDTEDGDLTGKIKVSGELDVTKAGVYELTYLVTDSEGNEGIEKRQVRVRTNEQPTIEGVEDITIKVGENFDVKNGVTAIDTEDGDLTTNLSISGSVDVNTEGVYNIVYSVKDKDNNETVVTRIVTVRTNTKPIIKGIEDVTIKLGDIFQRTAGVTAIDKEDGAITNLIKVEGKVNINALGEYDITYSVQDSDGNITTAIRKITVRSNSKPEIVGLNNITLKVGENFNPLEGIMARDNEDLDLTNKIIVDGNVNTNIADVYRINYSVIDSDGNKVINTRLVEVKTNEKPVLLNVEDATIKAGDTFELISGEVALDHEDGDISSKIKCIGTLDVNTPGVYELTYSVIDSDGNESIAKRMVTVNSNEKPIISGVDDLVIKLGDKFDPMIGVNGTDTEDGEITNLVNIKGTVDTSITGIYKLIYSVIDKDGNETIVNREVRVRSNEKPVISDAEDMTITLGYDFDKFISITARDKEDGDLTSLVSVTGDLDVNKLGVYNLTYSVTDDDGNTTIANRKITVRSNDKPEIIGTKNTIIKVGDKFDNMYGVTVTDTEDKDLTKALTVKGNIDTSTLGTYSLVYMVTDSDNNTVTSTRKVIVRSNDKPVIIGTSDKIIKIGENIDKTLGVEAKDTEDGEITNRIIIDGDLDVNKLGVYNLTYSVTDDDGNTTIANRKITVRSNDKPIILGANNITIKVGDKFNEMDGVTANDTEDIDLTKSIQVKGNVDVSKQGQYKLTYLVVDSDGNKSIVNRTIIVKSNEKPIIIGAKDTTIKIGDLFNEIAGVIAKDKEDGDLTKNINIKGQVDVNILGKYELTYSVIDKDGNVSEIVRRVTVRSNESPKILGVKNTIIKVGEPVNLTEGITAIDTEDNDLTKSIKVVENFNNTVPGIYEIVYQVTDSDENSTTVKKSIVVQSNDKPVILGVENTTIKARDSFDPIDGVITTDTEDGDLISKVIVEGNVDVNKVGDYELKYHLEDNDGNKVEAIRTITVRSNDKPIILNADYKTIKVGDSFDAKEGIKVIDTEDKEIEKNLEIKGHIDTKTPGIYKLTYVVIDSDGNETSIDREITVETNDKPIIQGNEEVIIKVGDVFDYFADIIASDTEDGDITDEIYVKGKVDTNKEGLYTLRYGVVDTDNNETIVTKLVTVRSNEKPVIIGEKNITLKLGDTFNKMDGIVVKDKEDGDITTKLKVLGDVNLGEIGRYVLTYSITDNDGNKVEAKRIVRVRSNDKPILTGVNNETIIVGSDFDSSYGIVAEDTEDGDITELITIEGVVDTKTVGEYELKYSVTDEDGNKTIASKIVTVRSNEKPVIKGADIITLKVGDPFHAKANVIAIDKEDGDLTSLIDIVGNVDTNKINNYDLTYVVKDKDGNIDKVKRRIRVRSNEKPIFKGVEDITIKVGDDFDPLTYIEAIDHEDGDLSQRVKVEGEVNINSVGEYELIYSVIDEDGNETKSKRIVTVRSNEKPIITGANKLILKIGDIFDSMLGISVNDLEDGDITNLVKIEGEVNTSIEDEYKLVYSVTDSDGNKLNIPRIIKVRSNEKPILKGVEDITIKVGDSIDLLAGVLAIDEEDGDLSELIEITGEVNENSVGEYVITYSITDDDNNIVTAKRIVTVRSNNAPIINGIADITLKQGDSFNPMSNIESLDTEDGNLTDKIVLLGEVDTNNIGLYRLTYSVIDSDENETIVRRKVKVRSNNKPDITGVDNEVIEIGNNFDPLIGVEAIDTEDGDISRLITVTGIVDNRIQGNYPIIYSVKDSDGNISSITRTITVKSINAPIILGIEDTSVKLGETFDLMSGVSAKASTGEDISEDIEVLGFVDTTKSGTYKLIYLVSDYKGNKLILNRNIIVENPTEPIIVGAEDVVVNLNYNFDPMLGVEVHNLKEGVTTTSIDVIGTVDTSIEGDYNLIYIITDSEGNKFTIERSIAVTSEDALMLNGADDITLRIGDNFDPMLGVILNNYKGEDLTSSLKVTGRVDTNISGIYRLVYSALDKDGNVRATTRDIRVVDKDTPIIYGINDLILNFGDKFDPLLGVTARGINAKDLNSKVKVIGTVDTNIPGVYNVVYTLTNELGKISTFNRNIEVRNKNGNLIRGVESVILREGDIFDPMAGVWANYKNEEEITKLIKVIGEVNTNKSGKYKLIYSLTDLQGVKSIVARSILVKNDKESLIQGVDDVEINLGEDFNPVLGVVAKDNENNDLTNLIKVEGNVDFNKAGRYNLIYSVIDREGYKTQIVRSIIVKDEKSPKIAGDENIIIKDTSDFNAMEGVVVRNNKGEDITDKLKLEGSVDNKKGIYELKYSVVDEEGNKLEQNRVITVEKEEQDKDVKEQEEKNILYDESGKAKVEKLVPHDKKPKPISLIGLVLMAIGKFLRRKKD